MAQAIPVVTVASPTVGGQTYREAYLSQPVIMSRASFGDLRAIGTLDLEGLTLERGELSTGGYGEGFVDRRHPHAYVHELLVGDEARFSSRGAFSIFAGRGFAPFGSDDPMVRPFEKYPINHHLAQVLERVVAVAAVRYGPVIGEFGTFNGDEPLGPGAAPNFKRFGDSWSSRVTVLPAVGVELSGSFASVSSPEERLGHGLDQRKTSLVARYLVPAAGWSRYAFAEYAHTDDRNQGATVTTLSSMLVEAGVCRNGSTLAFRIERTDRPEEETLLDPFRTPRPETDLHNLGVSRWHAYTAAFSAPAIRSSWGSARPFAELELLRPRAGTPAGIFSAAGRYGSDHLYMASVGVRLSAGMPHDRMGRYGAALPAASSGMHDMGDMPMHHMDEPSHGGGSSCF